ncbi:major facilitator superfamily transporter, partial [Paenibacillus sepulcri]|nr:major facilitator superfamily transporter [Paenibacillus sepulcri]
FSRNIGTAVGVTIMGAFLAKNADLMTGFSHMFAYGFIVSLIALASSLMIRVQGQAVEAKAKPAGQGSISP